METDGGHVWQPGRPVFSLRDDREDGGGGEAGRRRRTRARSADQAARGESVRRDLRAPPAQRLGTRESSAGSTASTTEGRLTESALRKRDSEFAAKRRLLKSKRAQASAKPVVSRYYLSFCKRCKVEVHVSA